MPRSCCPIDRLGPGALLLGVLLLSSAAAAADPCADPRVAQAKTQAAELIKQKRWDAALEQYAVVHALCPSPNNTFNIGSVCLQANRLVCAWDSFTTYLSLGDNPVALDRARRELRNLAPRLQKSHARLELRSEPSGATATVPGLPPRPTPTTLWLEPGEVPLELTLEGHLPLTTTVPVQRGQTRELTLTLSPLPTEGSVAVTSEPEEAAIECDGRALGVTPLRAVRLTPGRHTLVAHLEGYARKSAIIEVQAGEELAVHLQLSPRSELPAHSGWTRPVGWVGLGLSLAVLAGGGLLHGAAFRAAEEVETIDTSRPQPEIDREYTAIRERVEQRQTLAWSAYGVGTALALGSVLLLLSGSDPASPDPVVRVLPLLDRPGLAGLAVQGSWE